MSAARRRLSGTEDLVQDSIGHARRISELEFSHLSLSDSLSNESASHYSRVHIDDHVSNPAHATQPSSPNLRRLSQNIQRLITRRDSTHKRSNSERGFQHGIGQKPHRRVSSGIPTGQSHSVTSPQAQLFDTSNRLDGDNIQAHSIELTGDTTAGADTDQRHFDKVVTLQDPRTVHHKAALSHERPFTTSLGLPAITRPVLSASQSLELISDVGEQQQLGQERELADQQYVAGPSGSSDTKLFQSPLIERKHKLQDMLYDARRRTQNGFIPSQQLRSILNVDNVTTEIRKAFPNADKEQVDEYVQAVCTNVESGMRHNNKPRIQSYRKVFALLVLAEAVSSLPDFLAKDTGMSDQDLPIKLAPVDGNLIISSRHRERGKPPQCLSGWSSSKLYWFEICQWWLLIPFFASIEDGMVNNYLLEDDHILPFLPLDDNEPKIKEKQGGYGKVLMVRIHPDHHNFANPRLCERGFAVKQQLSNNSCDREAFKREAEILRKFTGERSHPHVVSLLATFEQHKKINLIFHRAEGDLLEYWKKIKPRPACDYATICWVAEQCAGLVHGLSQLHKLLSFSFDKSSNVRTEQNANPVVDVRGFPPPGRVNTDFSMMSSGVRARAASPVNAHRLRDSHRRSVNAPSSINGPKEYGRHGDLNPNNILWYADSGPENDQHQGTLKITDFGQAEISSFLTKTKARSVAETLTYRPPECDANPQGPAIIRQTYDIWCLGCVYLEFTTWLLGGRDLLEKFAVRRSTPDSLQFGYKTDTFFEGRWNEVLRCREFRLKPVVAQSIDELHEHPKCTDFLHDLLNMISGDMLVVHSHDRKPCVKILRSIEAKFKKCQIDVEYAARAAPWCKLRSGEPQFEELEISFVGTVEAPSASRAAPIRSEGRARKAKSMPQKGSWLTRLVKWST